MRRIALKPLSINECWQGRRFRTEAYKAYARALGLMLPPVVIPDGPLKAHFEFGFSNAASDADNPVKALTDILCQKYGFNDNRIYRIEIDKVIVPKGSEYLAFEISALHP